MTKLEDDYGTLAKHRRSLQELLDSDGWEIFMSYLLQAEDTLKAAILEPIKDPVEVYLREFQKGHRYALRVIGAYPQAFVDDINSSMVAMQLELELEAKEDDDEGTDGAADDPAISGWEDARSGTGDDGSSGDADGGRERAP